MPSEITCTICCIKESPTWWKCCPKHTTEQGSDVVCQICANSCFAKRDILKDMSKANPNVVKRLKMGDLSFGCSGLHLGNGSEDCPDDVLHHHHDEFCQNPTIRELIEAGIEPTNFRPRSRK